MNSHPRPAQLTGGDLAIFLIFASFVSLFLYIAFVARQAPVNEKAFERETFVRADIKADYNPPFLPQRPIYSKRIEAPDALARLADAARRSRLGHWGRLRCHLSADAITLTFTARSGATYTAVARRCAACGPHTACGKDPAYRDDDIDDPLLRELVALGFPLVQSMEPLRP